MLERLRMVPIAAGDAGARRMSAEDVLDYHPLISIEEAAGIMEVSESTVRRDFEDLHTRGLASYRLVGRRGHVDQRWCYTPLQGAAAIPRWRRPLVACRGLSAGIAAESGDAERPIPCDPAPPCLVAGR